MERHYNVWGWIVIAIGTIFFAAFIIDYNTRFLFAYNGLENLAAIISATTGICFSFAGLLFVLDNLELQRETLNLQRQELSNQIAEMKQTNEHFGAQNRALVNQQYQTTFFNLLNSSANRVSVLKFGDRYGYEGLVDLHTVCLSNMSKYAEAVGAVYFGSSHVTGLCPANTFIEHQSSWNVYFDNLTTLLRFVRQHLNEDLYYQLVYNSLSTAERFLVGLYCDCFDDIHSQVIMSSRINFKHDYVNQDNTYHLANGNYFPQLKILSGKSSGRKEDDIAKDRLIWIVVSKKLDLLNGKLDLFAASAEMSSLPGKIVEMGENMIKRVGDAYTIDFSNSVAPLLLSMPSGDASLDITLRFRYDDLYYSVGHRIQVSKVTRILGMNNYFNEFRIH